MTTKQRFFSLVLLLELIFLLLYVLVRVTSRFPVQLVISVSFLTVSSHWRNRWTNSINWLIWRLERSVQSDSIFLWKLLKLSLPLLFSLGLIIAMLSLLAFLRFSLVKSRVIICLACLIYKASKSAHYSFTLWSPLAANQQPDSIQNSSYLLPHYLWYSSSIPLRVASPLFSFSFFSFSLRYSDLPCPKGVQEDSLGEILSVYRTCHLELSFFLC